MDSRFCGNDTGIARKHVVIPAKAGIHADTSKDLKKLSIFTYRMQPISLRQHLTFADKILLGVLILISLAGYPFVKQLTKKGDNVQIEVDGKPYATLSLQEDQTLSVPGHLGHTKVVVQDNAVFVKDSPCRAKICVRTGQVSHSGQLIVCVPNKVVIRVMGEKEDTLPYDAITR